MEQHVVIAGEYKDFYYVIRRKGMKNMRMRVNGKGEVIVSCSLRISLERIHAFVVKNIDWVISEREKLKKEGVLEERKFVTGEKYLYAGTDYMLVVLTGEKERVNINGNYLVLTVKAKDENNYERKRRLIDKWYKDSAAQLFAQRFEACVDKHRDLFPDKYPLIIKTMKSRWGYCMISKKTIALNFKLVYTDVKCLDYVIMHELCHLYYKNHDKAFYAFLEELLPGSKVLRKQLTSFYIRYSHI